MSNSTKQMAKDAAVFGAVGIALSITERLIIHAMDPEVLVEEKAYLRNNVEILRKGFAK